MQKYSKEELKEMSESEVFDIFYQNMGDLYRAGYQVIHNLPYSYALHNEFGLVLENERYTFSDNKGGYVKAISCMQELMEKSFPSVRVQNHQLNTSVENAFLGRVVSTKVHDSIQKIIMDKILTKNEICKIIQDTLEKEVGSISQLQVFYGKDIPDGNPDMLFCAFHFGTGQNNRCAFEFSDPCIQKENVLESEQERE